ncbi:5'-nucleotidase C-terminal domain-containing protein [Pararhizobium haloflavum]|uniref:5'-nucleotidase C-terminal domain-containing protein n=1 Tax=Pararhizobium haloflavum TaxID=2037914 RepID=UPI000C1918F6|nr:5'-nucleotidase C-terminal domain-containing protein [Pararhizobium haloflavum]
MDQTSHYTLQLLHFADAEAGLLAGDTAPYLAALIDLFDDTYANSLTLSGGDNFIPGPFLTAGGDPSLADVIGAEGRGRPDIAILNALGVDASAIGNHEFDLGSSVFNDAISASGNWAGALFPHITANLDFSADSALSDNFIDTLGSALPDASTFAPGAIVPATVVTEGGERIGILGATTQRLENLSSPTGTTVEGVSDSQDDMELLASQLQPIIDAMIADGIDKIILTSHLQEISNEVELAGLLTGVDIILAAGSNTRLGDENDTAVSFPGHAADFADAYPLEVANADGSTTLIVNTDNEFTYLGRLVVDFDADGNYVAGSYDADAGGAYAASIDVVAEAYGVAPEDLEAAAFAEGSMGAEVREITEAVDDVINIKDGTVFGLSDVFLEGERAIVRSEETNLGNLTADANRAAALDALDAEGFVVSIKNGGGIRASIGAVDNAGNPLPPQENPDAGKPTGGISQLDIENALRFDNKLILVDTTPEGLLNILDFMAGVANNAGAFPQVGGISYSYDEGAESGSRIKNVALIDEDGNVFAPVVVDGEIASDAPQTISIVTLNFLADGGDGYPFREHATNYRYLLEDGSLGEPIDPALVAGEEAIPAPPENALGEQQALGDYLQSEFATNAFASAETSESEDLRIQNLDLREDAVFVDNAADPYEAQLDILYEIAFDRPGDPAGTEYWSGLNESAGVDIIATAHRFADSAEFVSLVTSGPVEEGIDFLYLNAYGREADTAELDYWDDVVAEDGYAGLLVGLVTDSYEAGAMAA